MKEIVHIRNITTNHSFKKLHVQLIKHLVLDKRLILQIKILWGGGWFCSPSLYRIWEAQAFLPQVFLHLICNSISRAEYNKRLWSYHLMSDDLRL